MRMAYVHFDNIFIFGDDEGVTSLSSLDAYPSFLFSFGLHQLKPVPRQHYNWVPSFACAKIIFLRLNRHV